MNVLVVDVGGTNVKLSVSGQEETRKIPSGPDLTPQRLTSAKPSPTSCSRMPGIMCTMSASASSTAPRRGGRTCVA